MEGNSDLSSVPVYCTFGMVDAKILPYIADDDVSGNERYFENLTEDSFSPALRAVQLMQGGACHSNMR